MSPALRDTMIWRIIASSIDFAVTYGVTGEPKVATGLMVGLAVTKTGAFYLWQRSKKS